MKSKFKLHPSKRVGEERAVPIADDSLSPSKSKSKFKYKSCTAPIGQYCSKHGVRHQAITMADCRRQGLTEEQIRAEAEAILDGRN